MILSKELVCQQLFISIFFPGMKDPFTKDPESSTWCTWNLESTAWNPESKIDCKTNGFFFLKISKEIGKALRKSLTRASLIPQSHSPFSASFQTFRLTARAYLNTQKYRLFCSLNPRLLFGIPSVNRAKMSVKIQDRLAQIRQRYTPLWACAFKRELRFDNVG